MNVSSFITTNYEQRTMNYEIKNKPNTNPIQTQFKPKQTQFQTEYLLTGPITHNYLPPALFPLTSATAWDYNGISSKISCFGESQMKGFGNE